MVVTVNGETEIDEMVTDVIEVTGIFLHRVVVDTELIVLLETTVFVLTTMRLRVLVDTDRTVVESVSVSTLVTVTESDAVEVSFLNFRLVLVTVTGLMV